MKSKNLLYLNIGLFLILIWAILLTYKTIKGPGSREHLKVTPIKTLEPTVTIEEDKGLVAAIKRGRLQEEILPKELAKDSNGGLERSPKEELRENVKATWSKVQPEDKTKLAEALDTQIAGYEEQLKANPEDKKAKRMLLMSKTLKELATKNFDYTIAKESLKKIIEAQEQEAKR